MSTENGEMWATVELMGHARTVGRVSSADWFGLLRVDVPVGDDAYRTEYYGPQAIYAIKIVSEESARALARRASIAVYAALPAPHDDGEDGEDGNDGDDDVDAGF